MGELTSPIIIRARIGTTLAQGPNEARILTGNGVCVKVPIRPVSAEGIATMKYEQKAIGIADRDVNPSVLGVFVNYAPEPEGAQRVGRLLTSMRIQCSNCLRPLHQTSNKSCTEARSDPASMTQVLYPRVSRY